MMKIRPMHGELITALEAAACRATTYASETMYEGSRWILLREADIIREHVEELKAAEIAYIADMKAEDAERYERRSS